VNFEHRLLPASFRFFVLRSLPMTASFLRCVRSLAGCFLAVVVVGWLAASSTIAAESSAPAMARLPEPSNRPRSAGPAKFVDAERGDDANDGSEAKPWRTITRALEGVGPGDTLYLRGGIYYENVRVAVSGREDAPLTIRSFPGELATIDAGYAEFARSPQTAWEPVPGTKDEYRSTKPYGNIRYAMGSFGDSFIGLNTYYHPQDLRAVNEAWVELPAPVEADPKKRRKADIEPVYCGPGLWYDPATSRIHVRLAHTALVNRPNYQGPTDPRTLPLIVTPAHAIPLRCDGANHVRFQDLVVRGGGHDTVIFEQCQDVGFDNITVWCGANGVRGYGLRDFLMTGCGVYGNVPPWTFRTDTSLRARPGSGTRDISRLNTHALLVPSAMRENDVYAFPQNDRWEISYCTFSDGHDGVYLGGLNLKFHHNLLERTQDDGIYLSPMYASYSQTPYEIHVYQNVIRDCLTAFAFGGTELRNTDRAYLYRNIIDLTHLVPTGRPTETGAECRLTAGNPMGDHGSPPWTAMWIYQNTVHAIEAGRAAEFALTGAAAPERPRYFVNNLLTVGYRPVAGTKAEIGSWQPYAGKPPRAPAVSVPPVDTGLSDGNLYWVVGVDPTIGASIFDKYRKSKEFAESQKTYDGGFTSRSLVADPQLDEHDVPRAGSPAIDAGANVPAEWTDPLREQDRGRPDIGALPAGAKPLEVGRYAPR
jgi:hypothetical protein